MRNEWFCKTSTSLRKPARARAFSLSELLIVVLIIGIILAIAVPSFTVIAKDIEIKQARSDIFAALSAARSRAIRDRQMVALHVFRDGPVYAAGRIDPDPTKPGYNQSGSFRWGVMLDPATRMPQFGIPHVPTHKLTMRLEVPNPCVDHLRYNNPNGAVEFIYLADHDPIPLPESFAACRPGTILNRYVQTDAGLVLQYEDFYIVFADDGKLVTTLVDYNLADLANTGSNTVATEHRDSTGTVVSGATPVTWSASGLCLYDPARFKALTDNGNNVMTEVDQYSYANRPDNTITISPYTGLPMSSEATK